MINARNGFGGGAAGGGLYVQGGALSIAGSTFSDNQACGGDGGQALGAPYSLNGQPGAGTGGAIQFARFPTVTGALAFSGDNFTGNIAAGGLSADGATTGEGNAGAIGGGDFGEAMTISTLSSPPTRSTAPMTTGSIRQGPRSRS